MLSLQEAINLFKLRQEPGPLREPVSASISSVPKFLNGRKLRDYQVGTRPATHAMCEHKFVPKLVESMC